MLAAVLSRGGGSESSDEHGDEKNGKIEQKEKTWLWLQHEHLTIKREEHE
jgi:hypothetical protein